MSPSDRLPPMDKVAEKALLGTLLLLKPPQNEPGWAVDWTIDDIRSIVPTPSAFYHSDHAAIFRAICDAHDAKEPYDFLAVARRLENHEQRDGVNWLSECTMLAQSHAEPANGDFYARQVRGCWQRREIIRRCGIAIDEAYNPANEPGTDDILATLSDGIDSIEQSGQADREPTPLVDLLRALENPADADDRIPVALGDLGPLLDGGFDRGTLTVIGARPSCGKTSLGLGFCFFLSRATEGCASLFVSAEMSERQIVFRLMSMLSGAAVKTIRSCGMDTEQFDREKNKAVNRANANRTIHITDKVNDVRAIAALGRRYARKHHVGLIVVDYLGLLDIAGQHDRNDLKIGAITKALKGLARDANVAVVLLVQLNRGSENDNREPRPADLRDSGCIEADADNIILIHKLKDQGESRICDTTLIVAKQRQGDTGRVVVEYHRAMMSYQARNYTPVPNEPSHALRITDEVEVPF